MSDYPRYLAELTRYVEEHLAAPPALIAALAALLTDPASFPSIKGQPSSSLVDFVQELVLKDRSLLQTYLLDPKEPVKRQLIDGKWCAVWRGSRHFSTTNDSFDYDVCISFAGVDREVAERIADSLKANGMGRRVFYDEWEKVTLWGEELSSYLHKVYSQRSKFCLILFSQAYRERAWTRHELRAAQARVLHEDETYVLSLELEEGAVPEEFANFGFYRFNPGDEQRIAESIERKINKYIGQHWYSIEEMEEILRHDFVRGAVLDGFRIGVKERMASGDIIGAQVLTVLALIAVTDHEHLSTTMRALVDLVLFAKGPVGESFDDDDRVTVFGTAGALRYLGPAGPLLMSSEGWSEHLQIYEDRWEAQISEYDEDPDPGDRDPHITE